MSSIPAIVSDIEFARSELLQAIEGLSQRELTERPIYPGWTIKEVLAHVLGWDLRTLHILPLILQDRAGEVAGVEVEEHNRRSLEPWRDKSLAEVLTAIQAAHRQVVEMISGIDHVQIDMRRDRSGRPITIRSYVIDVMTEHERQHAEEIRQWRKTLDQAIDPAAITAGLARQRAECEALLAGLSATDFLAENAIDHWSVKDMVGHLADWEQRILDAARHIYDPSLPGAPPIGNEDEWNEMMVTRRREEPWPKVLADWQTTGQALADFTAMLKPADWRLRGLYPWPNDQGTIAELVTHAAEHYAAHLPALARWRDEKRR